MANKPVHEIRRGVVKISIWKNETEKGVFYNTTPARIYRDAKNKWQTSDSYSRDQLLVLAELAREANAWIFAQAKSNLRSEQAAGTATAEQDAKVASDDGADARTSDVAAA